MNNAVMTLQSADFVSSNDTEIIVELISHFSNESADTAEAFKKVLDVLHGSYALGLIDNDVYIIPKVHSMLTPLVSVIVYRFISYFAALHRGNDVDKPRNLAKSVKVE